MLPEMKVAEITPIVYVCEAANENKVHMVAEIGPMEREKEFQKNPKGTLKTSDAGVAVEAQVMIPLAD